MNIKLILWLLVVPLFGCTSISYQVEKKLDQLETKVNQLEPIIISSAQMSQSLARYLQNEEVVITRVIDKERDKCAQLKWKMGSKKNDWVDVDCKVVLEEEKNRG